MVELVAVEIEAADQGAHRAVLRINGDEGRFHFRQLHDLPDAPLALQAHDRAAANALLRRRFRVQPARCEPQAFAGDVDFLPGAQRHLHVLRVGSEHDGGEQVVAVRMVRQQLVEVIVADVRRQLDVALRIAIPVLAVVFEHTPAQRGVSRFLVGLPQRRVDAKAARVHLFRVLLGERLTHHFGREFRVSGVFAYFAARTHRRLDRLVMLPCSNVAKVGHPSQDVLLAPLSPLRVGHRVVERGCLR